MRMAASSWRPTGMDIDAAKQHCKEAMIKAERLMEEAAK